MFCLLFPETEDKILLPPLYEAADDPAFTQMILTTPGTSSCGTEESDAASTQTFSTNRTPSLPTSPFAGKDKEPVFPQPHAANLDESHSLVKDFAPAFTQPFTNRPGA